MNEFFKLLRDFVIFIPLGVLIFGIFFSLISATKGDPALLLIGLVIFLYGLITSYVRQIYKDFLSFLRKEQLSNPNYLSKWKKYHRWYYFTQLILLGIFIYILWYFLFRNNALLIVPQITFSSGFINLDWNALAAIAQTLSAFLVAISFVWIAKTATATEAMMENQMMPSVTVNMIFDKGCQRTYFWFLNSSNTPALVEMRLKTEGREYQIGPYRIPPHLHPFAKSSIKRTAATFDFLEGNYGNHKNNTEAVLDVIVGADIKNRDISIPFTKSYRFNESNKEWDETTWSFPDVPFPE